MERPRNHGHGDYASTVALQAARKAGVQPRELAEAIAGELARDPAVRSAQVVGEYIGEYIGEIAEMVVREHPGVLTQPRGQALETFRSAGVALVLAEIRESLADFGVRFDVYFNESDLHDRGELDAALDRLTASGHVYQADGATWVHTTDFGDDKDRAYVRGNGEFTYFAADCAYYLDKRRRGFGKIIIILGADHHGYVGRMRAVAACFGDDPDQTLEILIGQLVNLVRDGQPVRMSKRAGTVVTIDDLVDAIGVDAARYALARYSLDSPIDLDLDLWTRRSKRAGETFDETGRARLWLAEATRIVLANGLRLLGVSTPDRL